MLSLVGLFIVTAVVILLLSGRVMPMIALSLPPCLGAIVLGVNGEQLGVFFKAGLLKVTPVAVMFVFAILYFSLMNREGLFEPLIRRMVRLSEGSPLRVAVGTVLVACSAHLDGSGASTFLITIPALLPLYQRLAMSPLLLMLLVSASASVMNMLPWGGPLGRTASVIGGDPTALWHVLIPVQGCALLALIGLAAFLGWREQGRVTLRDPEELSQGEDSNQAQALPAQGVEIEPKRWWLNLTLTLFLLGALMSSLAPAPFLFLIATGIALLLNTDNRAAQEQALAEASESALSMASILFAAAVFLGVLSGTGMLDALARDLLALTPTVLHGKLHIIIGILGAPLELLLNTDAYYFALMPVVLETVSTAGISPESGAIALIIGNIIGTFISPFSPALWLGLGLAGVDMGAHIRYALPWIWGLSLFLLLCALSLGTAGLSF
ncbi:MAG: citrate:proton symporter [Myxococcota bacterium]|nr:citrate:proton symporter [Myxococcota bacterium]